MASMYNYCYYLHNYILLLKESYSISLLAVPFANYATALSAGSLCEDETRDGLVCGLFRPMNRTGELDMLLLFVCYIILV